MAYFANTGKSLVVFGLKHGSSSISKIIQDLENKDEITVRNEFMHWPGRTNIYYKNIVEENFKRPTGGDLRIPIFIFIRDPKKAAISAWIEDMCIYLERNTLKCIKDIPEMPAFLRSVEIQEWNNTYPFKNTLDLKIDHMGLSDEDLKNLLLQLTEKISPLSIAPHFGQYYLKDIATLLKLLTYGDLRIDSKNIFILDLDNYDHSANDILVQHRIIHKEVAESEDLHFKSCSTKNIAKRVKPLFDELTEKEFFLKFRLILENLGYEHINNTYKELFYTPNRFKNFIQGIDTII